MGSDSVHRRPREEDDEKYRGRERHSAARGRPYPGRSHRTVHKPACRLAGPQNELALDLWGNAAIARETRREAVTCQGGDRLFSQHPDRDSPVLGWTVATWRV